jgi:hypothetical protein
MERFEKTVSAPIVAELMFRAFKYKIKAKATELL